MVKNNLDAPEIFRVCLKQKAIKLMKICWWVSLVFRWISSWRYSVIQRMLLL